MNTTIQILQLAKQYAKGLVAFVVPGVTALVIAVTDASDGGTSVTGPEWVGIGAACILTAGAVGATRNAPKPNKKP